MYLEISECGCGLILEEDAHQNCRQTIESGVAQAAEYRKAVENVVVLSEPDVATGLGVPKQDAKEVVKEYPAEAANVDDDLLGGPISEPAATVRAEHI